MTKDEALKLALEALEMFCEHGAILRPIETRDAIKEALAEPEQPPYHHFVSDRFNIDPQTGNLNIGAVKKQEPVAWEQFYPEMGSPKLAYLSPTESSENACYIPPQRTWVGLTDEELQPIADEYRILFGSWVKDFAQAIEAKLKEKNT